MPKVEAWKCPHTGRLFDLKDKNIYDSHLSRLARQRREAAKRKADNDSYDAWFLEQRSKATSYAGVCEFYVANYDRLYDAVHRPAANAKRYHLLEMELTGMRYNDCVSNSHSKPRGGITNWGNQHPDKEHGYPGFQGHIKLVYSKMRKSISTFGSSGVVSAHGVHTGTGGYRGDKHDEYGECYILQYDTRLFLSDWEGLSLQVALLREEHREEQIMQRLKGRAQHLNLSNYFGDGGIASRKIIA